MGNTIDQDINQKIENIEREIDELKQSSEAIKKEIGDLKKLLKQIEWFKFRSKLIFSAGVLIFGGFLSWKIFSSVTPEKSFLQNLPLLILALFVSLSVVALIAIFNRKED